MKGDSIFSRGNVKKIYDYPLSINKCRYHIESVEPILKEVLGQNETHVVIFNIAPTFSFIIPPSMESVHPFRALCEDRNIEYEKLDLRGLLKQKTFDRIQTPLDDLLPENSFFTKMPESFRSSVIQSKSFDFGEHAKVGILYDILCLRELIGYGSVLSKSFNAIIERQLEQYGIRRSCQKKAPAEFVFDVKDPVIEFLVEKSEFVLSDRIIRNIAEKYFRYLALLFMPPFYPYSAGELVLDYIQSLETIILGLLECKRAYKPLSERIGGMGSVLALADFEIG